MVNNQLSIISKKREFILEKLLLDLETEDPQIPRSTLSYRRSTTVEDSLQIAPFMQNKANFQKSQMNVNPYNTTAYEYKHNWTLGKNKPNQSQFPKSTNECKLTYNKGLQKKRRFRSPKKQTQFKANFRKAKMNVSSVLTKDYENVPLRRRAEFKPNQTQFRTRRLLIHRARPKFFNVIFIFYFIRYTQYDICDTQKHPANRVNRSCFAEKANVFRRILEKKMEV